MARHAEKVADPCHRESMGYCQEENEKQETKKCRWAEDHCQRNLDFHTTSAVPQTDYLHATPNCGSNLSKMSPFQVLSTYTVNEHTFQKANNSLNRAGGRVCVPGLNSAVRDTEHATI